MYLAAAAVTYTPDTLYPYLLVGYIQSDDNPTQGGNVYTYAFTGTVGPPNTVTATKKATSQVATDIDHTGAIRIFPGDYQGQSQSAQLLSTTSYPELNNVQAWLQAPPSHQDVFPDIGATNPLTINVNSPNSSCLSFYDQDECARVGYINSDGTSSSQ